MVFSLIPKNDAYFNDFNEQIAIVTEMVTVLHAAVNQPLIPTTLWADLKVLEKKADSVVKRCLSRLDESFVTPIEREDIHLLAVNIDDVADAIEGAASRIEMYDIREVTPEMKTMVSTLNEMMEALNVAVRALKTLNPAAVRDSTAKVDVLEEKVDELYRIALKALFQRRPEAYELVRWKDVYDDLEAASDHGRHVARTVNHILVRHS